MLILILLYILAIITNSYYAVNSRRNRIILGISVFIALIMMAENSYNPDFNNYSSWYNQRLYPSSVESGYVFMANLFQSMGLSYTQFRWILFTFCFIAVGYVAHKNTNNIHALVLLYFLYQIFFDYVQIRSTIAVVLLTLSIYYFSNKKLLISVILIFLSISMHRMMIIYLLMVPGSKLNIRYKKFAPTCVGLVIICCMLIFLNGNRIPFFEIVRNLPFLADAKFQKYFTTQTRFGFILPMSLQFINIWISTITIRTIRKNEVCFTVSKSRFCEIIYFVILASSSALPLVMVNEEFVRIFRNCNILIYIMVAIVIESTVKENTSIYISNKVRSKVNLYYVIVGLNVALWNILYTPYSIVWNIFKYNYLLS